MRNPLPVQAAHVTVKPMAGESSRRHRSARTGALVAAALLVATLALVAAVFWPVQLGGATAFTIVRGESMAPRLRDGDLAVVRQTSNIARGDIVLYRARVAGRGDVRILHRVVAFTDGGRTLVTRGDANSFDDAPVEREEVVGELWFGVPRLGAALAWVRQPWHLAGFLSLLAVAFLATGAIGRRQEVAAMTAAHARPLGEGLLGAGALLLALGATVAALGFANDTREQVEVGGLYEQRGEFAYSGQAERGVTYPSGRLRSPQPIYLELVRDLRFRFDYRYLRGSEEAVPSGGSIALRAVLGNEAGWSRSFPLAAPRSFLGAEASVEGRLSAERLRRIIRGFASETGSPTFGFFLSVVAEVRYADGPEPFTPELRFALTSLQLELPSELRRQLLSPRAFGSTTVEAERTLSLGPLALSIGLLRMLGLGLALLGAAAVGLALLLSRRGSAAQEEPLPVLCVDTTALRCARPKVAVATKAELEQLARALGRPLLQDSATRALFVVDDGSLVYEHRADAHGE
jgi:signal peptidase I